MEPWLIVALVIVVVIAVGVVLLVPRMRRRGAERKRTQAREHLQEAQVRSAHAGSERAAAEEQAARARREGAEAEERVANEQREAQERAARAAQEHAEAQRLEQRARQLAPDLVDSHREQDSTKPSSGIVHSSQLGSVEGGDAQDGAVRSEGIGRHQPEVMHEGDQPPEQDRRDQPPPR